MARQDDVPASIETVSSAPTSPSLHINSTDPSSRLPGQHVRSSTPRIHI
jgi:hypothetical protein